MKIHEGILLFHKILYQQRSGKSDIGKKFIIFGSSRKIIDGMSEKFFDHYKRGLNKPYQYHETGGPLPVSSSIRGKRIKRPIDWKLLQPRRQNQEQIRPCDQGGSVFHGLREADKPFSRVEYRKMLRYYINYFFSHEKTANDKSKFIFVGSTWDDTQHKRDGEASIIEAANLQAAGYICDLIYLKEQPITTLTEWCIPIFGVNDEIGD